MLIIHWLYEENEFVLHCKFQCFCHSIPREHRMGTIPILFTPSNEKESVIFPSLLSPSSHLLPSPASPSFFFFLSPASPSFIFYLLIYPFFLFIFCITIFSSSAPAVPYVPVYLLHYHVFSWFSLGWKIGGSSASFMSVTWIILVWSFQS